MLSSSSPCTHTHTHERCGSLVCVNEMNGKRRGGRDTLSIVLHPRVCFRVCLSFPISNGGWLKKPHQCGPPAPLPLLCGHCWTPRLRSLSETVYTNFLKCKSIGAPRQSSSTSPPRKDTRNLPLFCPKGPSMNPTWPGKEKNEKNKRASALHAGERNRGEKAHDKQQTEERRHMTRRRREREGENQ